MREYRPDRVVRVLTALVSIAYYGLGALAAVVLVGAPLLKAFGPGGPEWTWSLVVPVTVSDSGTAVSTGWGGAQLVVTEAPGKLEFTIGALPWWLFGVVWLHMAASAGLLLVFLYQLRRIFQRVRAGAPFDARNAVWLRRLGFVLLALAALDAVATFVIAVLVRPGVEAGDVAVRSVVSVDGSTVLLGLVLVALAEIFRRGAALEDEAALVV